MKNCIYFFYCFINKINRNAIVFLILVFYILSVQNAHALDNNFYFKKIHCQYMMAGHDGEASKFEFEFYGFVDYNVKIILIEKPDFGYLNALLELRAYCEKLLIRQSKTKINNINGT